MAGVVVVAVVVVVVGVGNGKPCWSLYEVCAEPCPSAFTLVVEPTSPMDCA